MTLNVNVHVGDAPNTWPLGDDLSWIFLWAHTSDLPTSDPSTGTCSECLHPALLPELQPTNPITLGLSVWFFKHLLLPLTSHPSNPYLATFSLPSLTRETPNLFSATLYLFYTYPVADQDQRKTDKRAGCSHFELMTTDFKGGPRRCQASALLALQQSLAEESTVGPPPPPPPACLARSHLDQAFTPSPPPASLLTSRALFRSHSDHSV